MSKEKADTELLSVKLPRHVKADLQKKAKKYNTDMSTLTKLIFSCVLKQI
ncbi:hypothetical protein [Methanosarcina horonobensis]|nr:hypothetical protein [Methanosarcina horonobensis]